MTRHEVGFILHDGVDVVQRDLPDHRDGVHVHGDGHQQRRDRTGVRGVELGDPMMTVPGAPSAVAATSAPASCPAV